MSRIIVTHAYSRKNAGDGLLVDETLELLDEAFPGAEVVLFAHDASSFVSSIRCFNPLSGKVDNPSVLDLIRAGVSQRPHAEARGLIKGANLIVAVGGGYLRASNFIEYLKMFVAHRSQLPAKGAEVPYVYLPQSIGPAPACRLPSFGRLRRAQFVAVRDDRSFHELAQMRIQGFRCPDLAVLAVARTGPPLQKPLGRQVGLVARALHQSSASSYETQIRELIHEDKWLPLMQSQGRGNDDPTFYRSLGVDQVVPGLQDTLNEPDNQLGVVVSIRLHGAIQAILSGVPSVHLSYERKGWGAFQDLGISEFVHNAYDFDLDQVRQQCEALIADPKPYWDAIEARKPILRQYKDILMHKLREVEVSGSESGSK